jgi:hypothetical protein
MPVCCPYCGCTLDAPAKALEECPTCHGTMHYEWVAGTSERCLMTDEQCNENEKAWQKCDLRATRRLG